jgi:hypothetical protein
VILSTLNSAVLSTISALFVFFAVIQSVAASAAPGASVVSIPAFSRECRIVRETQVDVEPEESSGAGAALHSDFCPGRFGGMPTSRPHAQMSSTLSPNFHSNFTMQASFGLPDSERQRIELGCRPNTRVM